MRLTFPTLLAVGLCAFAAAAVRPVSAQDAPGAQTAAPARSVNDGVYTASQARRGEGMFKDYCSSCHDLESFSGAAFYDTWPGPLDPLFDTVRTSMPDDNPGSLPPQVYADVISYFLRLNGYPAGNEELQGTMEAMHAVNLEPPSAAAAPAAAEPAAAEPAAAEPPADR
jgi:hypothetical protein